MKIRKSIPLLLIVIILIQMLCIPVAAQQEDLQLKCGFAFLMDSDSGQILYEQNAYDKAYPASMTKVMTGLLVLEALEAGTITPDTLITVSELAATKEDSLESSADLLAGEQMSVNDMMYCLLMPSANDAARAFAEHLAGSLDAFVAMMNQRAAELGCVNTHFNNVTGLHDPEHYTCAHDITIIFREAMTHELFRQAVSVAEYTTESTNLSGERNLISLNSMITEAHYTGYLYEHCIGAKTGSTEEAGKCIVSAAKKGDSTIVGVVMKAGVYYDEAGNELQGRFTEIIRLLDYGFNNYTKVNLTQPETTVATVAVTLSKDGKEVGVVPQGSIPVLLSNEIPLDGIQTEITLFEETVEAPVAKGQVMGSMRLYYGDQTFGELELVAEEERSFSERLLKKQNRRAFWAKNWGWFVALPFILLLIACAGLVALRYYNIYKAKQRRKRRQAAREAARRRAQNK